MCLCADGSLGQQGHAQRQALRHQRVGSFDVERVPSALAEARVTLCRAQGVALCKKQAELQTFMELIAKLWKQGKICGVCLWTFCRHHVAPREQVYAPKESSFPIPSKYIVVVRQKPMWTMWKRAVSKICGRLMNIAFSLQFGADPRDSHPEEASTPRLLMGGWYIDQMTSHIETRNDWARSVVICVQMF